MWPQWTYLALLILSLGIAMGTHGQPRTPINAWTQFIGTLIAFALLYFGGFFKGMF
jgi:hypothetical protein